MKKLILLGCASLWLAGNVMAHGNDTMNEKNNNHMGDHMHNGKMMNHNNPNGMTDAQMEMMEKNKQDTSNHMGDHMHEGKMVNHNNPNEMTDAQMKEMH